MPNISNPDAFQLEAATILAAAYDHFPTPIVWTPDSDTANYPTERGASREQIQFETIRWLIRSDYLTCEHGFVGGSWQGLSLTERGLAALNSVPDAISGREPLGKRLVAAVGRGSLEIIKQLIPAAIQQGLGA